MQIGGAIPLGTSGPRLELGQTYFANARSALYAVRRHVGGRVWLPDYTCPSVRQENYNTYPVDDSLTPTTEWVSEVRPGDLVVFVDYFGVPFDTTLGERVKARGAVVLEDAAQALFTPRSPVADFVIYSPPKFLGLPDGGVLWAREPFPVDLSPCPADWWKLSFEARFGNFAKWLAAKPLSPTGYYAMSDYSKMNLRCEADTHSKYVANYNTLYKRLGRYCLFANGYAGFPVVIPDRDGVRSRLFAERIYPPVHWDNGHLLARRIMTLPCDARYGAADMDRMSDIIETHIVQ